MTDLKRVALVVGAAAITSLSGGFLSAGATASTSDSGQCGVRVSGPTNGDSIAGILYTMRNKCSRSYSFRLYFPHTGRYSLCQTVGASEYGHYQVAYSDPDWQIKLC